MSDGDSVLTAMVPVAQHLQQYHRYFILYILKGLCMKNYSVYDISGQKVGTIQAPNVDVAYAQALALYGLGASVTPQLTANATGIDPIWIVLAVIGIAVMMSRKKS